VACRPNRRAAARIPSAPGRPAQLDRQRLAVRRSRNIATVAVARKLAIIVWHLLSHGEKYAFMRPALYRQKAAASG
jgi:transposase